jgi:hypothetical protein
MAAELSFREGLAPNRVYGAEIASGLRSMKRSMEGDLGGGKIMITSRSAYHCYSGSSASGKYRAKTGFSEDAGDFCALISLNLNSSFFDGAARAASLLHRFAELLFLRQTDADEPRHDSHRLAATMGGLPQDVDPAPVLLRCGNCGRRLAACLAGLIPWRWRQARAA